MANGRRTSLGDVARAAGVSVSTVSKVLNGRADVSAATRTRVRELLDASAYERYADRTKAPFTVLLDDLNTDYVLAVLRGVTRTAANSGVDFSLCVPGFLGDRSWVDQVEALGHRGVLAVSRPLAPHHQALLTARGISLVTVDAATVTDTGLPSVGATNWAGGLAATQHLIDLGHRRIGHITGSQAKVWSRAREHGYRAALSGAGIETDPSLIVEGALTREGGPEGALHLLDRADRPTAVFANTDLEALGVLWAAQALGLRVPEDVSLVGFDDLPVAPMLSPALTTVNQPVEQMGAVATRMLLDLVVGRPVEYLQVELATRLVVRKSTARPNN